MQNERIGASARTGPNQTSSKEEEEAQQVRSD
jgi:hypothetical protein